MIDLLVISTASVTAINRNVYAEINRRGWNVEMIVPTKYFLSKNSVLAPEPRRLQDPVIHFLEMKGRNPRSYYFPGLRDFFCKRKVSYVLIENDPVSKMAVQLGYLAKKMDFYLFSLSCENLPFDILPAFRRRGVTSLPASLFKKFLYLSAKNKVDTVFTINNDGTSIFINKGFKNVIKIPLGFDPKVFYIDEKKRQELRTSLKIEHPAIAYFGRMVEEKGIHVLIQALTMIKHLPWHFIVDKFSQGNTSFNKRIFEQIESSDIHDRILYIEADHNEIAAYMNVADIVVIPSLTTNKWKEQYGRVAPEAMACGKIVVASNSGALPELIEDCGIIVEEGNVSELSSVLERYLKDPLSFQSLGLKANIRAMSYLSLNSQADLYIDRMQKLSEMPF
jgi:glycosyltransferase involved in cell wall biosynthesis